MIGCSQSDAARAIIALCAVAALALSGCEARRVGTVDPGTTRITVKNPVVRLGPAPTRSATAYMTIMNASSTDDRLLSVATAGARGSHALEPIDRNGLERLEERPNGFRVPARRAVKLEPGGKHIVLRGLSANVEPGASMRLELRFERSGKLSVEAVVAAAAG